MTPVPGRPAQKYPVLIAGRVRAYLDWRRLEIGQRSRIHASRHSRALGYFFRPTNPHDEWAVAWIEALVQRYGVLRWRSDGPRAKGRWVREKGVKGEEPR